MTEFRALMAQMAAELDHNRRCLLDDATLTHPLADRARAALAKPADGPAAVAEGPSDEEWYALVESAWDKYETVNYLGERFMYDGDFGNALEFVRRELARWGQPPAPPAEGELAELVKYLRDWGDYYPVRTEFHRAAELLERHAAPVPVAVSERLPGPEDCDAEGRCWIHMPDIGTAPSWRLVNPREIGPYHTHWLPALPLPVPQGGEVEP